MIRYYAGVEGSGKTCMATRDLYLHAYYGGTVLAFPGYELYGNTKKQVLSQVFTPEQIPSLLTADPRDIQKLKIAIMMDEVDNWFNHHTWFNRICDMLRAALAQRRKLGIAVLMTGPEFETLPPDIKRMIHEVVRCWDMHVFNRNNIPSGRICSYYKEDRRGLLSDPRMRFSHKKKFYMTHWFRHYDTYSPTDPLHMFTRYKFLTNEVIIGPDGVPINQGDNGDTETNNSYIDTKIMIARKVEELKEQGVQELDPFEYNNMLEELGLLINKNTKAQFTARGLAYDRNSQTYRLHRESRISQKV